MRCRSLERHYARRMTSKSDVLKNIASSSDNFRRKYLKRHYSEAHTVLSRVSLIAANKTVAYYLKTYFPNIVPWKLVPGVRMQKSNTALVGKDPFTTSHIWRALN